MQRRAIKAGSTVFRAASQVTTPEGDSRTIRFIASNEEVDRYGDIVRAAGWKLDNFKKNPVLLYGHMSRNLPIGKVTNIGVEGTQLMADAEFMSAELSAEADSIYRMVKGGFLNAVSVGFMPTKQPNDIKDPETNKWTGGYEFVEQELLELSVVPVPAVPGALAVSRSFVANLEEFYRESEPAPDNRASAAVLAGHARTVDLLRLKRF